MNKYTYTRSLVWTILRCAQPREMTCDKITILIDADREFVYRKKKVPKINLVYRKREWWSGANTCYFYFVFSLHRCSIGQQNILFSDILVLLSFGFVSHWKLNEYTIIWTVYVFLGDNNKMYCWFSSVHKLFIFHCRLPCTRVDTEQDTQNRHDLMHDMD